MRFSSVQFNRLVVSDSLWPHGLQHTRPPLSITNSQSLTKLISIESVMPPNHFILCCPLLILPSILPSIRVFSKESVLCIKGTKVLGVSASASVLPMNIQDLISFRIDLFDLLAVQRTLKSSLAPQFKSIHSSKLSFLYIQLSHPYMTTGKTIALTRPTFVSNVFAF